jgi:hypothetical protein
MCTGRSLNIPDVLPPTQRSEKFSEVQSQYNQKALRETYLKDKGMSAFSDEEPTQTQTASESVKNYRKSGQADISKGRKPFDFRELKKEINKP